MESRAERRARRLAKIKEYKEAFHQGLINNPKIDPEKPIIEIRFAVFCSLEESFKKLAKQVPKQEHGVLREALDQTVAELTGRREVGSNQ